MEAVSNSGFIVISNATFEDHDCEQCYLSVSTVFPVSTTMQILNMFASQTVIGFYSH